MKISLKFRIHILILYYYLLQSYLLDPPLATVPLRFYTLKIQRRMKQSYDENTNNRIHGSGFFILLPFNYACSYIVFST
jgi:hypothetical protein